MSNTVKNILAVVVGVIVGMSVNMGLIMLSSSVIAPPEGVDVTRLESLKKNIHLFRPIHFLFPFLAHALGTLAAAIVASAIAASHKLRFAIAFGVFFLLGGIANALMIPAPKWFLALDLFVSYLPMAWLGWSLVDKFTTKA